MLVGEPLNAILQLRAQLAAAQGENARLREAMHDCLFKVPELQAELAKVTGLLRDLVDHYEGSEVCKAAHAYLSALDAKP